MADNVKEHNDKILLKVEKQTRLHQLFAQVYGASAEQAECAAAALADRFEWNGVALTCLANDKPGNSAETRALLERNYPFLFPEKKSEDLAAKVDAGTLARAAAGNVTALGQLSEQLGGGWKASKAEQEAAAAKARELVAKEQGKTATGDHAANPWSKAGWSLKKQGDCIRGMGTAKAAQIAAAVQSHIGATRPVQ